jgi:hypothetical protein
MRICWFTEWEASVEKLPRGFGNMRTEYAWYVAQDAYHNNINSLKELPDNSFDLGIIIVPKKLEHLISWDIVVDLKRVCKKYAFMQEGASWIFQDYDPIQSFWFYSIMLNADFFLCHNKVDLEYYESLLNKRGYVNPTLMIEDSIKDLPKVERSNVIIGGNLVRYYGGFNSLVVGLEIEDFVYAPSMGRMHKEEKLVQAIKHIPYYSWVDWIAELNKYKYAVHLNPNSIAGTFSLNCAYLGIPCIGNINSDAQRICYPKLSSHPDDLKFFKKVAKKLKEDNDFYMESSEEAKINYMTYYSEEVYKNTWNTIIQKEFNTTI